MYKPALTHPPILVQDIEMRNWQLAKKVAEILLEKILKAKIYPQEKGLNCSKSPPLVFQESEYQATNRELTFVIFRGWKREMYKLP